MEVRPLFTLKLTDTQFDEVSVHWQPSSTFSNQLSFWFFLVFNEVQPCICRFSFFRLKLLVLSSEPCQQVLYWPFARNVANGATALQRRYSGVTTAMQQRYSGVLVASQRRFNSVTTASQRRYNGVTTALQWRYSGGASIPASSASSKPGVEFTRGHARSFYIKTTEDTQNIWRSGNSIS